MGMIMRLGIVGSGNIVKCCIEAVPQTDSVQIVALCVLERNIETGKLLQSEHQIDRLYTNYEQFLADPEIDFVYLGIPNSLHFPYSLKALQADKHLICEKPFTTDLNELKQLADLAKAKRRFLFEAITTIYSPNVCWIKEHLNEIGQIKLIQSNYSQYSSRYDQYLSGNVHPAFDPAMSGGALYDINIYNVHLSCFLFGQPAQVEYFCNKGFNGIDTSGVLVMQYPDFVSVCSGAKDSASPSQTLIQGEKGYIRLTSAPNTALSVEISTSAGFQTIDLNQYANRMVSELNAFAQMFNAGDYDTCYRNLDHSLSVMHVLTDARNKAGILFL